LCPGGFHSPTTGSRGQPVSATTARNEHINHVDGSDARRFQIASESKRKRKEKEKKKKKKKKKKDPELPVKRHLQKILIRNWHRRRIIFVLTAVF
jgi:hypothetical protein